MFSGIGKGWNDGLRIDSLLGDAGRKERSDNEARRREGGERWTEPAAPRMQGKFSFDVVKNESYAKNCIAEKTLISGT